MGKTSIVWCDESSNPIRAEMILPKLMTREPKLGWHCTKISAGCRNCYAERLNKRFGTRLPYTVQSASVVNLVLAEAELARWSKIKPGMKVFVADMTDLFGEHVPDEIITKVFAAMALNPHLIFQVLTKRTERMMNFVFDLYHREDELLEAMSVLAHAWKIDFGMWDRLNGRTVDVSRDDDGKIDKLELLTPFKHIWLGTSAEDQRALDQRLPFILDTPAAVRFLSLEPLLGPISLQVQADGRNCLYCGVNDHQLFECDMPLATRVSWVICGGESGPQFRAMDLDWARSLRDQCTNTGIPFFYKQDAGPRPGMRPQLDGQIWQEFPIQE